MAALRISFLTLALFVVAGILFSGSTSVSGQPCKGDLTNLAAQCLRYVQKPGPKVPPSKECCSVVKTLDIPCFCKNLPPGIGAIVSIDKVVYVARQCGVTVKPGSKCGGFTAPPNGSLS